MIRFAHAKARTPPFKPLVFIRRQKSTLSDGLFSPGGGGEIRTLAPGFPSLTI